MNWENIKNIIKKSRNLTILGISDLLIKGISAVFWFYMATELGAEPFGQISYFIAIASIGSTISLIGSSGTLTVYTAKKIKLQSTIYFLTLIFGSVSSLILFIVYANIGVGVFVIGHVIFTISSSVMLGSKQYSTYAKYLIIQNLSMVGLSIGFYFLIGWEGVLVGIGLSYFAFSLWVYKGFKESILDFSLLKSKFGFLINNYIMSLAAVLSGNVDRLIIFPMLGFTLLGNYALGLQILAILTIIPANVFRYILPQDSSGTNTGKLRLKTILLSIGLAFLGIVIAPILIPNFFPKFTEATEVIQIISISIIPSTITSMYTSKLLGNEKSKIVLFGSIIFIGIQSIGIILLGQLLGINGAAIALVISSICQALFLISMSFREDKKLL
jgi:O-antigen/teichoic acid export membrane protein